MQRRLGAGRRLVHFATLRSRLSRFAAVVHSATRIVHPVLGVLPVTGLGPDFFGRFIPFAVVHQMLFQVVVGLPTAVLLVGTVRLVMGMSEPVGTLVNVARAAFDLVVLSALVTAARHTGHDPQERNADAVHG